MTERLCLRCDWTGASDEPSCPRCGAPLYRLGSESAPPRPAPAPDRSDAPAEAPNEREDPFRDHEGREQEALAPVAAGERGRGRVIVLALVLTAAVAFALTRGGEPAPGARDQARAGPAGEHASPSLPTNPSPGPSPPCPGGAAPPASLEPSEGVPAATADYQFQDSLEASLGDAPDLAEVERGSSVFTVDATTGTTVLRFAGGRGLRLAPTTGVIGSSTYTMELLFRLDFVSEYRKIVDFKHGSSDAGLYLLDGCLAFFPREQGSVTWIGPDSFVQVVLTRDADDQVVVYVDGVRQFGFADTRGLARADEKETLRFFVDDHTTTGEHSSGAVSQIRLFDQTLTESEVAALACTELAIADATSSCREL